MTRHSIIALATWLLYGFETGDYRNFLPKYVGGSDAFVRPQFSVTDTAPIAGDHSLRWTGGKEDGHRWLLTSNAFYLRPPLTARVDFRIDAPLDAPNFGVGLMILETYEKLTGVWARAEGVELVLDSAAGQVADRRDLDTRLAPGTIYTLEVSFAGDGGVHARLCEAESEQTLAELRGETTVHPHGLALAVDEPEGVAVQVAFDNVRVEAAPYRVRAETWTRGPLPHFVILPRRGDVPQAEGNWVGGHGLFRDDDRYHMWYRIRNNEIRGAGYGYAFSEDGLEWDDHRIVIDEPRNKDADVVYVDGTYYLYAISPDGTSFGVFTSDDGLAGYFSGLHVGIPTHVAPDRPYEHERFPYDATAAKGLSVQASSPGRAMVTAWSPDGAGSGLDLELKTRDK